MADYSVFLCGNTCQWLCPYIYSLAARGLGTQVVPSGRALSCQLSTVVDSQLIVCWTIKSLQTVVQRLAQCGVEGWGS